MKPEETIFDGISDSEMESISGGIAEVQSESQSESAAGDGYADRIGRLQPVVPVPAPL